MPDSPTGLASRSEAESTAASARGSARWQADSGNLSWVRLDDNYAVYHHPSGKTHLLNQASYGLLTQIMLEPIDTISVASRLMDLTHDEITEEVLEDVYGMLVRYEFLGLVDRVVHEP